VAGAIYYNDGKVKSFLGSVNETKSAFANNYELVWQDDDFATANWVEAEFNALWEVGIPLPDVIIDDIDRIANRQEVTIQDIANPTDMPAAAMVEAPIYRGGEQLQPWQKSFVAMFVEHRETYGKTRLLLADEVGVGKTLSMATSALISCLFADGPVLILVPATLKLQWQTELLDKLGINSAVWSSDRKAWLGTSGQLLSAKNNSTEIQHCPHKIGIVSTGLISQQRDKNKDFIKEAALLLKPKFGMIILDEAHKARSKGGFNKRGAANNLLAFMRLIAKNSRHIILGTATPIQTDVSELWDLFSILAVNADFVLGDKLSLWRDVDQARALITGKETITSPKQAWDWLHNPLPARAEHYIIRDIRDMLAIADNKFECHNHFTSLEYSIQMPLESLDKDFFKQHNPILRHTVLRKRKELEEQNLLEKVGVDIHPRQNNLSQYFGQFDKLGISTNNPFMVAYEQAEKFSKLLAQRTRSAGFMKTLLLQRICSSFAAGNTTVTNMLNRHLEIDDDEHTTAEVDHILHDMTAQEIDCLTIIKDQLARPEAKDPKLETVKWFLTKFTSDGKTWLEHGCIIFSQYYATSYWIASNLAKLFPNEVIALYAGADKSKMFRDGEINAVIREQIKTAVKNHQIKLVIATDAACEGLNLQTLGTLINIDLPWNPSRLEQRLGRIKRFGQARKMVDMLNLVYHDTLDEKIYQTLSERMQDVYDIFGSLPDTIEDDWITSEVEIKDRINTYLHEREKSQNAFSVKYRDTINPEDNQWQKCTRVLSRRDIIDRLDESW
jgi:superfamily II DNA or RNA helicase